MRYTRNKNYCPYEVLVKPWRLRWWGCQHAWMLQEPVWYSPQTKHSPPNPNIHWSTIYPNTDDTEISICIKNLRTVPIFTGKNNEWATLQMSSSGWIAKQGTSNQRALNWMEGIWTCKHGGQILRATHWATKATQKDTCSSRPLTWCSQIQNVLRLIKAVRDGMGVEAVRSSG